MHTRENDYGHYIVDIHARMHECKSTVPNSVSTIWSSSITLSIIAPRWCIECIRSLVWRIYDWWWCFSDLHLHTIDSDRVCNTIVGMVLVTSLKSYQPTSTEPTSDSDIPKSSLVPLASLYYSSDSGRSGPAWWHHMTRMNHVSSLSLRGQSLSRHIIIGLRQEEAC